MNDVVVSNGVDVGLYKSNLDEDCQTGKPPIKKSTIVFFVVLCLVLIFSLQGLYSYIKMYAEPTFFVHLTGTGDTVQLDRDSQKKFARLISRTTDTMKGGLVEKMNTDIERRVDGSFDQLQNGVDGYLEWYFSAPASYMRMYAEVTQELDEWTVAQLQERLVDESGFSVSFGRLKSDYRGLQTSLIQSKLSEMQNEFEGFLQTHGTSVDIAALAPEVPVLDLFSITKGPGAELELARLQNSIASGGIGGIAAGAIRYGGVKAATVFVRQFIARVASHGTRAAATGAASAAATSFTGPFAIGIGIATTSVSIAAFVGTEYIALNAQETLYRPKMEQDLRQYIELKREETKTAYRAASGGAVHHVVEAFKRNIAQQEKVAQIPKTYRVWAP